MSIPPLISMFLQYSYNLIDSAFVARLSELSLIHIYKGIMIQNKCETVGFGDNKKVRKRNKEDWSVVAVSYTHLDVYKRQISL